MKKTVLFTLVVASFFNTLNASQTNDIDDFESLLNDVSDIAVKKSLNIDYLPSVVSIVDSQTFIDAGIQNIGEALDMLPGIQMQTSPMGYTMTTVRGLKNPNAYLSDKIKILIDGVAINNEISGSSSFYMDFPMQLVHKIEVLRGPGSTVYGAGAFYATINVITKLGNSKKENQVFLGAGSYKYLTAGTNLYTNIGDWDIFADGYYQKNDKKLDVPAQEQRTAEDMDDLSIGFKAINGGFEFLSRYKQNSYGNFYSFEGQLNPIEDKPKEHNNKYFFSQISYKTSFNDYQLKTKANFSHRELDVGANIDNVAGVAKRFEKLDLVVNEGFVYREKSQEQNFELESEITLPEIKSNDISISIGVRYVKVKEDSFYNSIENAITQNLDAIINHPNYDDFRFREENEPAFWANPTTKLLKADLSRTITYGSVEDLISVNNEIDVVLGLRVDNYSDFDTKISKRAGVVYRPSDTTVLKLLYGSAFRAPTFIEAYQNGHINFRAGDENIKPEETNTYEAEVVYSPNFNNRVSLNLYYSDLSNVIDLEEDEFTVAGYQNYEDRVSKGVEFSYRFRTELEHNFYFNASYTETDYTIPAEDGDPAKDQSMPDISKVMLKAMYIYRPINKLSFGTTWKYLSETTTTELQWVLDEQDKYSAVAKAVHIFDETITYRFSPNSELRATVKNIFDADIRQPAYYYYTSDGGIQREGRNYFVSYLHKF